MRTEHYLLGILDGWFDRSHRLGEEHSKDSYEEWEPDYTEGYWYGWNMAGYLPDEQLNESRNEWRERIRKKW